MASSMFHLIFLVVMSLLPFMVVAQTTGHVSVGASITAADDSPSWPSSSGEFAFGFHELENKDHFLLSIWYDKIPEKTIVWYANGNESNYLAVQRGSKVQLTADRGLVLADPQGNQIWTSGIRLGAVSSGVMNDTGNFMLQTRYSDRSWESFNNPTDTLLPTQIVDAGGVVSSRRTETNFSPGRFQLHFQYDGNLALNAINLPTRVRYNPPYYSTGTNDTTNSSNTGYQLIFNESGYMYILRRNGPKVDITETALPTADYYHRATLNFDGVFTQYLYPKTSTRNRSWSPVSSKPNNICVSSNQIWGGGVCGFNSICSPNPDQRPVCTCPREFSLLDQNEKHGSCIPDFELSRKDSGQNSIEDLYDFVELRNVDYPSPGAEHLKPHYEEQCRKACLNDCLCGAVIFSGDNCRKKLLPLSNGRVDSGFDGKTLIKFRKGYIPPATPHLQIPETKTNWDIKVITGIVLLGSSVFVNFILVGTFCLCSSFTYRNEVVIVREGNNVETNLRSFTYKELTEATEDFKDELGRGSFGIVYKCVIKTGFTKFIAVKKLDGLVQDGEKEFKTEVDVIGQTHHKNLVRLLGFCKEGQHRLLVYEFLSNGTLANFLFGSLRPSWKQRTQIAFGIARGLLYLHEECSTQIIHCDIKPQNILLDDYYNA